MTSDTPGIYSGANVREVGRKGRNAHPRAMRPTLVLGVTDDMTIAHEDIFGQILPVPPAERRRTPIHFLESEDNGQARSRASPR
jgi:acyl-CoA reductase-like NAD-dependent aldehyde dehydrogenase